MEAKISWLIYDVRSSSLLRSLSDPDRCIRECCSNLKHGVEIGTGEMRPLYDDAEKIYEETGVHLVDGSNISGSLVINRV